MLQGWVQIAVFVVVLIALIKPVGIYMARVFTNQRVFLSPVVGPIERLIYKVLRVRPDAEGQDWKAYARSLIVFSLLSWLVLYLILRTQSIQPFNPAGLPLRTLGPQLQHRLLLRHQHQLAVLRRRNDAHLLRPDGRPGGAELRLRRGRDRGRRRLDPRHRRPQRRAARQLLAGPGPHHPLHPAADLDRRRPLPRLPGRDPEPRSTHSVIHTLTGGSQILGQGPVASQEAIKELGTNGGGFFNVNSAFPFENPSGLTNFVEMLLILVIPASLTYTYGRMVGSQRQGWAIFSAMFVLFIAGVDRRLHRRAARHRRPARSRPPHPRLRRLDRRQHGGQGAALRDRQFLALDGDHHGHLLRRGQRAPSSR